MGSDKVNRCKIRIVQCLCNSMQILPDASDASCSSDGKQNGIRECQENWPLKHRSLNKTKPNAYLNVWGRRGFTLEQSCSNMRYLHSVQLPSHCGLSKQYSSPILPPPPKKPPPKLVFLWPVIKTWVWMRASVSLGTITHTHSERELTLCILALLKIFWQERIHLALIGWWA